MTDFRGAVLGRVTLETPPEFEAWRAAAEVQEAARAAKKAERESRRKGGRSAAGSALGEGEDG